MKKSLLTLLLLQCMLCYKLAAQSTEPEIEQFISGIFEDFTEETGQEIDYDSFLEELITLSLHPINLNNTNREELEKLMFLSDMQIENLLFHLYRFGKMDSLYELQLVNGLDMTDIRRMLPFVTVDEAADSNRPFYFRELFSHGKNDLIMRFDLIPERKAGYLRTDSGAYTGDPVYQHLKYRYQFGDKIFLNLTAEKDAGEAFFGKKLPGYDFYGASFQLKETGKMKNLVIGDFQAGFGQGLVVNQAFGSAKSAMTTNLMRVGNGFKRSGSVNEYNFLRGMAVSLEHQQWTLHAFYSNKNADGAPEPAELTSLYNTGYHRTESELAKKHTVNQQFAGLNLGFQEQNLQVGLTATYMHLNRALSPPEYPYNLFYFRAKDHFVSGLHYRLRDGKVIFFGETAFSGGNGWATLNGLTFAPLSRFKMTLLYRNYAPEYNSLYAAAFSEGTRVSNESGWYAGFEILPVKKWKLSFYADSYHFPWLKYGVDAPVSGRDLLLHAAYQHSRSLLLQWRLKHEQNGMTETDDDLPMTAFRTRKKTSIRWQILVESGDFIFKHTMDGNILQDVGKPTYGLSVMEDLSYQFRKIPLKIDLRYQFFDAVSYDNRIYSFEKDLLYAFSAPAFSGLGSRYYVNMSYEINRNMRIYFKFAQVIYADDREETGTGNELITGNRKTELKLLFRWRFRWK